ncbi:MAG: PAS domain S-box protein [Candidatus Binatia bacterium]
MPIHSKGDAASLAGVVRLAAPDGAVSEQLARENEERFRALMEQAPFSVQVFSPAGCTLRVNRAFEELFGVRVEQMAAYNILEDAQLEAAGTLADIRRGFAGETLRLAPIYYDPNKTVPNVAAGEDTGRWLSGVIYPLKDARGRVREVVIIHEDITARIKAEEERARSARQTLDILESITDAFFVVDSDWKFSYVNPQAERLLERSLDDLLGRVMWEEFQGLAGSEFEQVFRRAATERIKLSVTSYYPDHNRWYAGEVYPATGGGLSVFFRDVSERKNAAEALRKSERLYRAIGESIDYGVWVCDPEGRNTYSSESFLRLVGLTQQEYSSFGWGNVLHPADVERTMAQWKECVKSGGHWDIEHRYRGVDGRWHPILARGVPVRNEQGEITAWAGINLDISRLKQVEVELREADRRKDEFLATLAHELRNPLAPIRNSLEILKMPRLDPAMARQTREMMERQVHHLVRLVDDLLDVSRVMRGKIELRTERVELATIVARAVETAGPLIELHGHRLEIDLPPESLLLEADPVRLAQVVGNLLTNAAKYTEANGRIRLTAELENNRALLKVRDNGIGIAPEMLPYIFDLFVQVDYDASRSQSGLGIGLTLVAKLVEMHGGSVSAHSEGLGKGCEITVRLPLGARVPGGTEGGAHDGESAGQGKSAASSRASGLRLLVVDDNEDAATSLAILLRLQGHDVRVAYDGPSALEAAAVYAPDLVFLDLGMPGMDGCEIARRMRKQPGLEQTVLAALTGWGQKADRRRTAEAGFDHHLVKPLEPRLLEKLIADLAKSPNPRSAGGN